MNSFIKVSLKQTFPMMSLLEKKKIYYIMDWSSKFTNFYVKLVQR